VILKKEDKKMGLMGTEAKRVYEPEVIAVPEPPYTNTWHPMSHGKVIQSVKHALEENHIKTDRREYSLSKDGKNMFGAWVLEKVNEHDQGIRWSLGMRNSLKKQFAVGICAGNNVTVCDNMIFDSEFVEFRKHTAGLDQEEMYKIATKALQGIIRKMEELTRWHLKLKEHRLTEKEFKALTFDAMKEGAFPPSQFDHFREAYDIENKIQNGHAETLYAFHGAATRIMRTDSFFAISEKSNHLTGTIDDYMEKKSTETGKPEGFFQRLRRKKKEEE
jgi:hypothetical protein